MSAQSPLIEHLFRQQAGRVVARLTRLLGPANVELAEDAVQEALVRAVQTWPYQGVPDNPAGWIYKVAHHVAIDIVRRDRTFSAKSDAIVAELSRSGSVEPDDGAVHEQIHDDELRMIFMCCHPEISPDSRVALSLKIIGGFSVREIARAFLCDDAAIAQRIVRAKRQIRERQLTLDLPSGAELAHRLDSALDVIYLMFNEGYSAHEGSALVRQDLCVAALRLGRIIAASRLVEPRVHALVALMALQAARFPARVDASGDLVPLEDQDRRQWDERLIAIGFEHFDRSIAGDRVSPFHVQAAIAATYARAQSDQAVDWRVVLDLYDQLVAIHPSPIVVLNRAVAVSRVHGPAAGLAALDPLDRDPLLRHYHLLMSVRGQLLLDVGRRAEARAAFEAALACECSDPERRFLERKILNCEIGKLECGIWNADGKR
jgi:RNA polymerase sigma-70 factor (ECF subfamily)